MIARRRLLRLAAASAAAALGGVPARAGGVAPLRWRGAVLDAPAAITLHGTSERAEAALASAVAALRRAESVFALHDPASALARLNRTGRLARAPDDLLAALRLAGEVHAATAGRFEPTVQPLWRALAEGRDPDPALALVGWDGVRAAEGSVTLGPGQALTLNGLAQGWAADRAAEALAAHGFERALVDAGEFRALGGPWRLGVEDPRAGLMGWRGVAGAAVATSSPGALRLPGGAGHILDPARGAARARWSTVTVEAPSAALADAASTAFCLIGAKAIREAAARLGLSRVLAVDSRGDLSTLV